MKRYWWVLIIGVIVAVITVVLVVANDDDASSARSVDEVAEQARHDVADATILWNLNDWQGVEIRTKEQGRSIIESIRKLCSPGNTSYGAAAVAEDNPFLTPEEAVTVVRVSMKSYDGKGTQVCDFYR